MAEGISAGTLYAEIQPDWTRFGARLRNNEQAQRAGDQLGRAIGRQVAEASTRHITAGIARAVRAGMSDAGKLMAPAATRHARAYMRAFRDTISKARPVKVPVVLDDKTLTVMLAGLRRKARESGQQSGDEFGDGFEQGSEEKTSKAPLGPPKTRSRKQGEESGGGFADGFRKRVDAALKALPPVTIGVARNEAEQQLKDLTAQLRTLASQRVGVDVDAGEALRRLAQVQQQLEEVSRTSPDVQVRADTAAAQAQLAQVLAAAAKVNRADPTVTVDADTGAATARLAAVGASASASGLGVQSLISAIALLGPVAVPAAAAAAAALAAIGPAALVGAAGIGVAVLAFTGVGDAVKALGDAEAAAGKDAAQAASRQASLASAVDGVRTAQRNLANTRAQVAEGARRAAQRVEDAERDLIAAQRDALDVQRELTEARREAREELEDLDYRVRANALAQKQAAIDESQARRDAIRAQEKLNQAIADGRAGDITLGQLRDEAEAAKLRVDQEVLGQERLRVEGKRLAAEQQKATKAGVEGSEQVQAVRERIAQADERVAQAARNLSEARIGQQQQERQAAAQLAAAQQAVVSAQRSLAAASVTAGAAGSAAMTKLNEAMGALSPTGQRFARFLHGLRDEFARLKSAAEESVLPGVEAGIRALLPILPQVELFIRRVGGALGGFFEAAGRALASPFWQDFFDQIGRLAGPMFKQFGRIIDGVARGFATLMIAFAPLAEEFTTALGDMAQGFADWAAEWVRSPQFQEFLDYMRRNGPKVADLLLRLAEVALKLLIALAPLGEIVLDALLSALDWLADQNPTTILYIAGAIAAVVAAVAALAAGPVAAIGAFVVAVVAMIAVIVNAYRESEKFRRIVDTTFGAIADSALWLWNRAIKPTFGALVAFMRDDIGPTALWLWNRVLKPAWAGISDAVSFAWNKVIKPAFEAFRYVASEVIAPLVMFLWRNVFQPAWSGIQLAIQVAWSAIKIVFGAMQIFIKAVLAPLFTWLWRTIIKPAFDGIAATISYVWNSKVKPVFQALGGFIKQHVVPAFQAGLNALSAAWGRLRELAKAPVTFVVNSVINPFIAGYNKLAKTFGVTEAPLISGFGKGTFAKAAAGGILPGYTPGRDIHRFYSPTAGVLELSGGEPVLRPEAGRVLGAGWVHGVNAAARAGGTAGVRRYLAGGQGDGIGDLFKVAQEKASDVIRGSKSVLSDPAGSLSRLGGQLIKLIPNQGLGFSRMLAGMSRKVLAGLVRRLRDVVLPDVVGGPGSGASPFGGSGGMMSVLRQVFPGLRLISGFRPGSMTLTGNRSYHASDRAVDVPPLRSVAEAINRSYRGVTRELITPWQDLNLLNGRPYHYTGAVWNQHNFAGGNAHVHWAAKHGGIVPALYDQGGYLPPGLSLVANATGKPEPVLTDQQWQAMRSGAGGGPREVHNWTVRDTTLTPQFVARWQDKRDALARVARTNA